MEFKEIEPKIYVATKLYSKELDSKYYKKFAKVKARQGVAGEVVVTVMKDGLEESV